MKQLTSMLRKHCESCAPSLLDEFDTIFDAEGHDVGFIVNERIINIPPQISPPSFDALRYAVSVSSDIGTRMLSVIHTFSSWLSSTFSNILILTKPTAVSNQTLLAIYLERHTICMYRK